MHRVFVYGTLKRGQRNHQRFLGPGTGARFAADTEIEGLLSDLGTFPAVVLGGEREVRGELFEVQDEALEALDRLEGVPDLYQRSRVRWLEHGEWPKP
jgi:gamma-glutamylcyclotransferase (GGCT)/AIG2-like uncharacterized protein YtfP